MITALLLACSPLAAQLPIDATLDTAFQPASNLGSGSGSRATSAFDDFNRANSTSMGADWTEQTGDIEVLSNQGHGVTSLSMMTHNGVNDSYDTSTMSAKFDTQGGLVYVAMVAGYSNISTNVFVKVQDNNSSGDYDRVFFYFGNNGGSWSGNTGYYFDLATPTVSGTMTLSFTGGGDVAQLDIANDASGATETFTCGGLAANAGGLGTGFGVGTYGGCYFDDFTVNGGGGLTLSTTGAAGGSMTFDVSGATPAGPVAYCYAFGTGSHPAFNPLTGNTIVTGLASTRFTVAYIGGADAAGNSSHTTNVPGAAAGLVHVQCVDAVTDGLTNVVAL
ncbi:MAG: hypothetical protein H8E15_10795 [Planctomycetes bacterium]|nr:hypothetical protein [Planctomycetota bacterium]